MNIGIEEKIATIYNCHIGYVIHGETKSEGTFGKAYSIQDLGVTRVEVFEPNRVVMVWKTKHGYHVSFKSQTKINRDLEEAARQAIAAGEAIEVTRF